jgi:predicted GTPase
MGRWSGVKLRLNNSTALHFITVYRVCAQQVNNSNSMSTSTQQYRFLQAMGIKSPNPRNQVLSDLSTWIETVNKADHIIIAIDANENVNDNNSGIGMFIENNDLCDIYSWNTQDDTEFPTHINGSRRIDYMLCTRKTIPYISRTGITKFHEGLDSDHRAMFCDIKQSLFTNVTEEFIQRTRQIGTNVLTKKVRGI